MLADTDAGNIVTAAQAGAQWRYRLLALPLLLIPVLYVVQELAARLGLFTGSGFGALVRQRFGRVCAAFAAAILVASVIASLVAEFDGIAGIAAVYGLPRWIALLLSAGCLLGILWSGGHVRVERAALLIGLFEVSFFAIAWTARPSYAAIAHDVIRPPWDHAAYFYLGAALIGATFNPWMIFYQPAALAAKGLGPRHHAHARIDTAFGAVLTQMLTASMLVAAAATIARPDAQAAGSVGGLKSVGEIGMALRPVMGDAAGLVFAVGVIGASMVAAIVCLLALGWGLAEATGWPPVADRRRVRLSQLACVGLGLAIVMAAPDLVALSVASQALNALMVPALLTLLVVLAATVLPAPVRLRGVRLWIAAMLCATASVAGLAGALIGALAGLF